MPLYLHRDRRGNHVHARRANAIRAVLLEMRGMENRDPRKSIELDAALKAIVSHAARARSNVLRTST